MSNSFRTTKEKRIYNKNMREHNILNAIMELDADGKPKTHKQFDKYDKNEFDNGVAWFESGLALNDADDIHKNNSNFIRGFDYARRLSSINQRAYEDGKIWFVNGNELDKAAPNFLKNEYFVKGYNEAKENSTKKGL